MRCLKCLKPIDNQHHHGLHITCFSEWFNTDNTPEFVSLQRRTSASSEHKANLNPQNTSFFHGKFKKYSAKLNNNSYILKMRQDEAPELPEVEYLCNQIGKLLGIPVAEFYFINFNGEQTFVTKNFITSDNPTDLQHIYHFRNDDQHNCSGIINAIKEKTGKPHAINIFIQTILFDALIGNHDRHGRNLAFIITAKNCSLSPIYDNVSYLSLESGNMLKADFNPTGKIHTSETFEPSMRDYVKELIKLGYKDEVNIFYKRVKLEAILQLIDNSFCSSLMKNAMKSLIEKRFTELKNELSSQT